MTTGGSRKGTVSLLLALAACRPGAAVSPFAAGQKLLQTGNNRAAVEVLATVPWSAPDAMAARRLIGETCTRIDLAGSAAIPARLRIDKVEVVDVLPHDRTCYTQGLELDGETLIESCGHYGRSRVRRVDVRTGAVLAEHTLDARYFAEGITRFNGSVFVLTWLEKTALVFDSGLGRRERSLPLRGEGWGLTHDATHLISSDGTHQIRFMNAETGRIEKTLQIFNGDVPLLNINELEYVNGELLANIFPTDRIARIDASSGRIVGWILAEELRASPRPHEADVLNGIAHDPASGELLLTGKLWRSVLVVRLKPMAR